MAKRTGPTCAWFARCNHRAAAQVDHPTLGWVNICSEHLAWLGDSPSPTQFVPPLVAKYFARVQAIVAAAEADI